MSDEILVVLCDACGLDVTRFCVTDVSLYNKFSPPIDPFAPDGVRSHASPVVTSPGLLQGRTIQAQTDHQALLNPVKVPRNPHPWLRQQAFKSSWKKQGLGIPDLARHDQLANNVRGFSQDSRGKTEPEKGGRGPPDGAFVSTGTSVDFIDCRLRKWDVGLTEDNVGFHYDTWDARPRPSVR